MRAGSLDQPSYEELPRLLVGRRLALVAATWLEAEPLLAALGPAVPMEVATKLWVLGGLQGGAAEVPAVLVVSGYDKANAAHALTALLQAARPDLVLQFGIGGAFPGRGLSLRDLVLASAEIYGDTGTSSPEGWLSTEEIGLPLAAAGGTTYWNRFSLDETLVARAAKLLAEVGWGEGAPVVATGPCVTVSQVTGRKEEAEALGTRWEALAESMEGAAAAHVCALYGVPFLELRAVSNLVGDRDRTAWDLPGAAARAARAAAALGEHLDDLLAPAGRE